MPGLAPPPTPKSSRPVLPAGVRDLLGELLAEQHSLSAVDQFARWHDRHPAPADASPSDRYRRLLPASPPAPGQQYGFEVHLDLCSGCKACVTACHSLNGLETDESWRTVGLLLPSTPPGNGGPSGPTHVTTACHHCADPACLAGCPVLAYEKDPRSGIVRHLDDQCIGCSYCTMTCPYEVPRYSARLGIVRKCDLCQGRLAVGEPPACAQACPNDAIRITVADPRTQPPAFPPSCPDPALTTPATRYVSRQPLPTGLQPTATPPRAATPHTPLAIMLVLTQAATGILVSDATLRWLRPDGGSHWILPFLAALLVAAGLAASTAHLGQPLKAWRAWLGWRQSWLSREILVFGLFLPLAFLHAGVTAVSAHTTSGMPLAMFTGPAAAGTGIAGVLASSMVYIATRRRFWAAGPTWTRFLGTTALGALAALAATRADAGSCVAFALATAGKPWAELAWFRARSTAGTSEWQRARSLLLGELAPSFRLRIALAAAATLLSLAAALGWAPLGTLTAAALAMACGEWVERTLYFRGVVPDSMPGVA